MRVFSVSETEMREAAAYEKLRVERDELVTLRDRLQQTIYKIQDVVGYAAEGDELVREVSDLHQRFEAASFAVRDALYLSSPRRLDAAMSFIASENARAGRTK